MIEQTIFALPFAYLGVLFAGGESLADWVWVTIALAAARTAGMSFNRVIDAEIDSKNPRTRDRLIPSQEIESQTVWWIGALASMALIGASYMLNDLCFYLSFPVVAMLLTYSYFKRFSATSHFYLGLVEALAPIGGYVAVTGAFSLTALGLGFVIMMWIAGLDIVYALQDEDFDKKEGLHSIPAGLGAKTALVISSSCYMLAILMMILVGIRATMSLPYWMAVFVVGGIFFYQQQLVRNSTLPNAVAAFFRANRYVSPTLLAGTALSVAF